jgi:hypothetical protein
LPWLPTSSRRPKETLKRAARWLVAHFDDNGVGDFYANDNWKGTPEITRFEWKLLPGDYP